MSIYTGIKSISFDSLEEFISQCSKLNIDYSRIGKSHGPVKSPMEGLSHSEMTKRQMSETSKRKLASGEKVMPSFKGCHWTDEQKAAIAKSLTGRKQSQETKDKRAAALRGKPSGVAGKTFKHPTLICPHCGQSGGNAAMKRWHFDNCKSLSKKCQ